MNAVFDVFSFPFMKNNIPKTSDIIPNTKNIFTSPTIFTTGCVIIGDKNCPIKMELAKNP